MSKVDQNESAERSPYQRIRVGRVTAVYATADGESTPSESSKALSGVLGRVQLDWADGPGGRDMVPLTFPSFSNPVHTEGDAAAGITPSVAGASVPPVGRCYGDISLPSVGDLAVVAFRNPEAPIIIGWLPANYFQQTSDDASKPSRWGTMRAILPGELSRKSAQQAEIYQDQGGAVQIIVKAQPTALVCPQDGSATNRVDDISAAVVPHTELARVTIGECYTDDSFAQRDFTGAGVKKILRVTTKAGTEMCIDTNGNVVVNLAPNATYNVAKGTFGVARVQDQIQSVFGDDQNFWGFFKAFVQAFQTWNPVPLDGGAALKTALAPVFAQYPQTPQSLTGHISQGSSKLLAGN